MNESGKLCSVCKHCLLCNCYDLCVFFRPAMSSSWRVSVCLCVCVCACVCACTSVCVCVCVCVAKAGKRVSTYCASSPSKMALCWRCSSLSDASEQCCMACDSRSIWVCSVVMDCFCSWTLAIALVARQKKDEDSESEKVLGVCSQWCDIQHVRSDSPRWFCSCCASTFSRSDG